MAGCVGLGTRDRVDAGGAVVTATVGAAFSVVVEALAVTVTAVVAMVMVRGAAVVLIRC